MTKGSARLVFLIPVCAMVSPAAAHVGVGSTSGFVAGASHPLSGADHLLAMLMIGVWASLLGGRALWFVPAAFLSTMAVGGVLGTFGFHLPFAELMIAASVVGLGILIAFDVRLPVAAGMVVAALFAVAHGYVHGSEMPGGISGLAYGSGFVVATALLHAAGIGLGLIVGRLAKPTVLRWAGAAASAIGLAFIFSN